MAYRALWSNTFSLYEAQLGRIIGANSDKERPPRFSGTGGSARAGTRSEDHEMALKCFFQTEDEAASFIRTNGIQLDGTPVHLERKSLHLTSSGDNPVVISASYQNGEVTGTVDRSDCPSGLIIDSNKGEGDPSLVWPRLAIRRIRRETEISECVYGEEEGLFAVTIPYGRVRVWAEKLDKSQTSAMAESSAGHSLGSAPPVEDDYRHAMGQEPSSFNDGTGLFVPGPTDPNADLNAILFG